MQSAQTSEGTPPPRPNRLERRKAETRRRIVEAATELFLAKGYDATSIHDIADLADIAPATLYLHFSGKADVALVQFHQWIVDFIADIEARPEDETPDQMLAATLKALAARGYASSQALRDPSGQPVPVIVMGILFTETAVEISGRVYEILIEAEQSLSALFAERLGFPSGSIEPQIIASAFIATWRVTIYGFANMVAAGVDPPAPDQIGLQCFDAYTDGLRQLWTKKKGARQPR